MEEVRRLTNVEEVLKRAQSLIAGYDDELARELPGDAEVFAHPPEVALPVIRLLRGRVREAVPVPQRMAASSQARQRYEAARAFTAPPVPPAEGDDEAEAAVRPGAERDPRRPAR